MNAADPSSAAFHLCPWNRSNSKTNDGLLPSPHRVIYVAHYRCVAHEGDGP
jgi:hypothetical protein